MQAKCGCDLKGKGPEAPPQVVPPRTSLDNTAASAARKTALQPGGLPCPALSAPLPPLSRILACKQWNPTGMSQYLSLSYAECGEGW